MDVEDLILLREIAAQGGNRYTVGNVDRGSYQRLAAAGFLTPYLISVCNVLYELTPAGEVAANR